MVCVREGGSPPPFIAGKWSVLKGTSGGITLHRSLLQLLYRHVKVQPENRIGFTPYCFAYRLAYML